MGRILENLMLFQRDIPGTFSEGLRRIYIEIWEGVEVCEGEREFFWCEGNFFVIFWGDRLSKGAYLGGGDFE